MTDKELKKLNRLELLELLLEVSNENNKLKQEIEKMNSEKEVSKSIDTLSEVSKQASDVLGYANKLVETMKILPMSSDEQIGKYVETEENGKKNRDKNLYLRIMNFYVKNEHALNTLSPELKSDITNRIREIKEGRKNNS